jgi:hypothetical protein
MRHGEVWWRLDQPRIVPTGDDRLIVGMPKRMGIRAALRVGFRIAVRPDAGVVSIPGRRIRQRVRCDERPSGVVSAHQKDGLTSLVVSTLF